MLQGNETSRRTAFGRLAHLWRAFPKSSSIATVCTDGFRQGAPEPSVIGHSGPSTDPRPDITPIWRAWDRSPRFMQLRQEVTYNRRADHKSTGCNGKPIVFQGHGGREVTASFDGGRFSSDGGALLLHEADKVFGVSCNACLVWEITRQMRRSCVVSQTKSLFSAVAFRVRADIGFAGNRNNPGTFRPLLSQAVFAGSRFRARRTPPCGRRAQPTRQVVPLRFSRRRRNH